MNVFYRTMTSKGQTTVPAEMRDILKLKAGDRLRYIHRNGEVVLKAKNKNAIDLAGKLYDPNRPATTFEEIGPRYRLYHPNGICMVSAQAADIEQTRCHENVPDLLAAEELVLEDEQVIEKVFGVMAGSDVEFADAFIALKNSRNGCAGTVTFGQAAARSVPGMECLT